LESFLARFAAELLLDGVVPLPLFDDGVDDEEPELGFDAGGVVLPLPELLLGSGSGT
jgi:hypothetical protein